MGEILGCRFLEMSIGLEVQTQTRGLGVREFLFVLG
jgi:hypothetical protein